MKQILYETWITPFSLSKYPSVGLISELNGDSTITLVVAPTGTEEYPKFLVDFQHVYAFSCEEEAGSNSDFGITDSSNCAFVIHESSIISSYSKLYPDIPFRGGSDKLKQYVIYGGDNVVSVVAASSPSIKQIDSPLQLSATYDV